MKRSSSVKLVLITSALAMLEGCGRQQCVDETRTVVDDRYCRDPYAYPGGHGYRWYSGSYFSQTPIGSTAPASGTVRGVFGGAGDAAGHGGAGAGE